MSEDTWEQKCIKYAAWDRAREDYIENGMEENAKWKRCVKSGNMNHMNSDCWDDVIAAYPAP